MLWLCDIDQPIVHLTFNMWDSMVDQRKAINLNHKIKIKEGGTSSFYEVVYGILVDQWIRIGTPFYSLAYLLILGNFLKSVFNLIFYIFGIIILAMLSFISIIIKSILYIVTNGFMYGQIEFL